MNRLLIFSCSLLLAGCGGLQNSSPRGANADGNERPPIQTSQRTYEAQRTDDVLTLTVPLTFENRTGQIVYINQCQTPSPPSLQKKIGGEWQTVYAPPRLMCLEKPVAIEAGARYDYVFEMQAARGPNAHPKLNVKREEGTYRLVWQIYRRHQPDQAATDVLTLSERVSNAFQITG